MNKRIEHLVIEYLDVGTDVRITFSEPLDAATVVAGCVTLDDGLGAVTGSVSLDAGGRTVVFAPEGDLAEETEYTITVAGTIRDKAGNAFAGGTYAFTTWEPLTDLADGDGCLPGAGHGADLGELSRAAWSMLLLAALAGRRRLLPRRPRAEPTHPNGRR